MSLSKKNTIFSIITAMICLTSTVIAKTVNNNVPRDVEIGVGGDIKIEDVYRAKLEEIYEWHAHLHFESRYITEGRDNLSGKGIASLSSEFNYKEISIIPWVARGINTDYTEVNLNLVYGTKLLENLQVFAGYNSILSREANINSHDDEITLDLAYFHKKRFQILGSVYYSFDASGVFTNIALKKKYRLNNALSINLKAILGVNSGYVTDGHDGINYAQFRANFNYLIMKELELYAYTGYSLAVNRDNIRYTGDELLKNMFWGGIGLSYRF
ncbi:MAG: hypothetical protein OQK98_08270 [Gammaproteobacteria bacterium]|nr:hypothetical protein [Gammaproteobacteria bacterium]